MNISRNDVCYFQVWPTETSYNIFHYLSLLDWLDFDIWSVPCPENGWNSKKHFHISPCFQLYILWARNTFLLHLPTEGLWFISYKASVISSNTVKKGIKNLRSVYCVLDLCVHSISFYLFSQPTYEFAKSCPIPWWIDWCFSQILFLRFTVSKGQNQNLSLNLLALKIVFLQHIFS